MWTILALLAVAVTLLAGIMVQRKRATARQKHFRQRYEELVPSFVGYISDGIDIFQVVEAVGDSYDVAEELILDFLERVAGSSRWKLVSLAHVLGVVRRTVAMLQSKDWTKRDLAAMNMGIYGIEEHIPLLERRLTDSRMAVRFTAARSLGMIGTPEAVEVLFRKGYTDLLDAPRIVEVVQNMQKHAKLPLQRILDTEDDPLDAKLAAIDLVGDMGEYTMTGVLHEILKSSDKEKVVRALKALGKISHPMSIDEILRRVTHEEWEVRAQAVKAIGQLEIEEAVPVLGQALSDSAYWVRRNAAEALVALGEPGYRELSRFEEFEDIYAQDAARYQLEKSAIE
ncbi:HEAT repeat domain-containing protein [bacterium]|nr:HEAT repeat domain-containing protein [bacterium]